MQSGNGVSEQDIANIESAEKDLRRRIMIGSSIPRARLVDDLVRHGHSEYSVIEAIRTGCRRGDLQLRNQGRVVTRKR